MPLLILHKVRQFKKLALLQHYRLARRRDPFSAYQHKQHHTALVLIHDMLKQHWSVMKLERHFLGSRRFHTEYKSRTEVVDKLLAALTAYEQALTHQAAESQRVRYDLKTFERTLFAAIYTLHLFGSGEVVYEIVRRPPTGWQHLSEYESWLGNRRLLLNERAGKLTIREWEAVEVGKIMDGELSVTFSDDSGEDLPGVFSLDEVLPKELIERFQPHAGGESEIQDDEESEKSDDIDDTEQPDKSEEQGLDNEHQGNGAKLGALVPQGRRRPRPTIKLKNPGGDYAALGANSQETTSDVVEKKPPIVLRLKKSASKVESETDTLEHHDFGHEDQDPMILDE